MQVLLILFICLMACIPRQKIDIISVPNLTFLEPKINFFFEKLYHHGLFWNT
jgi:hypothetical protein